MYVIPTLMSRDISKEPINQCNHKIKSSKKKDDTRFFTEIHLLPGKLVLVVAMHPLDGSRAN
jgi:hypothetical protein